jgi:hypothetical protein
MAHMRYQMLRPRDSGDASAALRFGKLAHMALLEPMVFARSIAVWDGGTRRGKAWDAWQAENEGKADLTPKELDTFTAMQAAIRADKDARFALSQASETERVFQWQDDRLGACKARLDGYGPRVVVEFKTCRAISKRSFLNQAESLGYGLQLAWYWHAAGRPENVWLVAQESVPPFCCVTYNAAASVLESAYQQCEEIALAYRAAEVCGNFAGPHPGVQAFERPAWSWDESEVDLSNGEIMEGNIE